MKALTFPKKIFLKYYRSPEFPDKKDMFRRMQNLYAGRIYGRQFFQRISVFGPCLILTPVYPDAIPDTGLFRLVTGTVT